MTARRLAADVEIFPHGEIGEDAAILGHETKAAPGDLERPQPRNLFAKKANHAVALRNEPHQRLDRGRLAGAVAAHESHHLAAADVKRRLKQYLRGAVPGLQSLDFEHRRAHWVILTVGANGSFVPSP